MPVYMIYRVNHIRLYIWQFLLSVRQTNPIRDPRTANPNWSKIYFFLVEVRPESFKFFLVVVRVGPEFPVLDFIRLFGPGPIGFGPWIADPLSKKWE